MPCPSCTFLLTPFLTPSLDKRPWLPCAVPRFGLPRYVVRTGTPPTKLYWWRCFFFTRIFLPTLTRTRLRRNCLMMANGPACYPSNGKLMTASYTFPFTWILVIRLGDTLIPNPLNSSPFYKALRRNILSRLCHSHDSSVPLSFITLHRPFHMAPLRTLPHATSGKCPA